MWRAASVTFLYFWSMPPGTPVRPARKMAAVGHGWRWRDLLVVIGVIVCGAYMYLGLLAHRSHRSAPALRNLHERPTLPPIHINQKVKTPPQPLHAQAPALTPPPQAKSVLGARATSLSLPPAARANEVSADEAGRAALAHNDLTKHKMPSLKQPLPPPPQRQQQQPTHQPPPSPTPTTSAVAKSLHQAGPGIGSWQRGAPLESVNTPRLALVVPIRDAANALSQVRVQACACHTMPFA
jgi:hypothetical protein